MKRPLAPATPIAPIATPVTIVGMGSVTIWTSAAGVGLTLGYGTIMKKGDEDGVKEPFVGQGVIMKSGVLVGVWNAVGVEEG